MGNRMSVMGWRELPNEKKWEVLIAMFGLAGSMSFAFWIVNILLSKMDPTEDEKKQSRKKAQEILLSMGIEFEGQLNDYELCIAANLVNTNDLHAKWSDIGGLEDTIAEIQDMVILPFTRPELYAQSSLTQPPKGVLLHGPPGCGKTMIAKATAKAAGARFINLQASSLFDKWYGESQKRAEAIFSLAYRIQPTIIFIDEVDAFLRARDGNDHESTALIKAQFMSLWDGLATDDSARVMIMGATNRPLDVDSAFRRRMPCMFKVNLPTEANRKKILDVILKNEQVEDRIELLSTVARETTNYSGSDLKELCRQAAVCRVRFHLQQESTANNGDNARLRPFNKDDFSEGMRKMRNTSQEIRSDIQATYVDTMCD